MWACWSGSSVFGGSGAMTEKTFSMVFSDGKEMLRAAIVATGWSRFSRKRGYSWVMPWATPRREMKEPLMAGSEVGLI